MAEVGRSKTPNASLTFDQQFNLSKGED